MLLESMVMRRMRIILATAHTKDCEKSKIALKAIIRLITGLSTFSGRDITITRAAISTVASHMATGGRLPVVHPRAVTFCTRTRRMSSLRVTSTVVSVTPSAALYGRGERQAS